jgi:hypothetical protein
MEKEIKPAYSTFEQAKWLKEKGFDEECTHAYCQSVNLDRPIDHCFPRINQYKPNVKEEWLAPEHWFLVEWLRLYHDIWVEVRKTTHFNETRYQAYINEKYLSGDMGFYVSHEEPQQAYSAAFDYIKDNNLI